MRTGQIWISKIDNSHYEIISLSDQEVTLKNPHNQLFKLNRIIVAMQFSPLEENTKQRLNRTLNKYKQKINISHLPVKDRKQVGYAALAVAVCLFLLTRILLK